MDPTTAGLMTAILGAVIAFAREQVKRSADSEAWWRDRGMSILEKLVDAMEKSSKKDEERDQYLRFVLLRLGAKQPDSPYDPGAPDG